MPNMFTLIPTKMISKIYINGVKIDYEEYLTELINNSCYFMSLTSGTKFKKVLDQSHSEPDVVADNYELDFKLLVNQEFVNAKLKSLPDVDYTNIRSGFICVNDKTANESNLTPSQANCLFVQFLQSLALLEDDEITNCGNNKGDPLYSTVNMLKKEKNLLVFIPSIANITDDQIPRIITTFLASLFSLRDNINKDTFVTLLCQDNRFCVLKYENKTFRYIDKVHRILMPSFNDIYRMTYFLEND